MFRAFVVIWMVVMIMAGLSFTDRGTRIAEAAMGVVFSGTAQSPWRAFGDNMGSDGVFLATGAEPSTPGVVTLAGMQAVSKAVIHKIPDDWSAIKLTNSSTTDADSTVYDLYVAEVNGDFTRVCTLTFTTGTGSNSKKSGYEYADTLVVSNYFWYKAKLVSSPVGNYISLFSFDVYGAAYIALVPTTLTNNSYVEIAGLS